jgi:hypothetical protein
MYDQAGKVINKNTTSMIIMEDNIRIYIQNKFEKTPDYILRQE